MRNQEIIVTPKQTASWDPVQGDATEALGELLLEQHELPDRETFDKVVGASARIVRYCKRFDRTAGSRTGLIVGYVQSGKTISMTTVASLARDNGCRLVVLLAGVTDTLLKQTARDRIGPYLQNKPDARRAWRLRDTCEGPNVDSWRNDFGLWLQEWKNESVPEARQRPLFISVMKQHDHLSALRDLFRSVDIENIPSLVIDDEADQASLNTTASKAGAAPSTTYQCINDIRLSLRNHTYLQYTATPQAPLLISLSDMLSPDFACVLEPGSGYTGGRAFFLEHRELVTELPEEDLFARSEAPETTPESLLTALRQFFVGAAVGVVTNDKGPRSMLVHPSPSKGDHDRFHLHTTRARNAWLQDFRSGDATLMDGVANEFRDVYSDLATTGGPLPPFEQIRDELPYVMADTQIWKVNSEDGREVKWDQSYPHILVGGDKLNRGFTVKGLTVTYMPRRGGGWNADTIQQRARFFGYKKRYLGLCRVHLAADVADAYQDYVEHEQDVRAQLAKHEGRPLKEWKRAFLLGGNLKATRTNILSEMVFKGSASDWFRQNYAHAEIKRAALNKIRVADFVRYCGESHPFEPADKSNHGVAILPLREAYGRFLVDYECFANDAVEWTAMALWLKDLLYARPNSECFVVRVNNGGPRKRAEDSGTKGRIEQLFEGRRAKGGADAYVGDAKYFDPKMTTIQIHDVLVHGLEESVPAIAVKLPDTFEAPTRAVQLKRGQE